MLRQQQSNMDAASARVREIQKEVAAQASARRDAFVERRTAIYAKRQEEAAKREKVNAEYHKKEAAIAKRGAEFAARQLAEWKERAAEGADAAEGVSRAHTASLTAERAKQEMRWNDDMKQMEARIHGLQTSRSVNAREHARQHVARTLHHKEVKADIDALKEEDKLQVRLASSARLLFWLSHASSPLLFSSSSAPLLSSTHLTSLPLTSHLSTPVSAAQDRDSGQTRPALLRARRAAARHPARHPRRVPPQVQPREPQVAGGRLIACVSLHASLCILM